ncbi:MAG: sugar phosphate isomerase [Verrucomicrobiae bacterium]|nr:sugar phosphate isomerase [Verrucomicrobiae bacterium]
MHIADPKREAEHFVQCETQFHLGALPTEQSHPKTRGLSDVIAKDTAAGIRMLQAVDEDVTAAARRAFASSEFKRLVKSLKAALRRGNRVCFSGCGATGRLSILLEAAYRKLRSDDSVCSITTGGDYALVRSVEFFEDYMSFGRQQVIEAGLGHGDVLVAITEGGETSSVIGTAWQALEAGAEVFFVCNNPLDVLAAHVERSRKIIEEPRITKLDLSSGPMAIAGSTRMQATTTELLVVGAALEMALGHADDHIERFAAILRDLGSPAAVNAIASWVEMEESLYRTKNAITYFGNELLLDIFTDTTERAPTFSLPPFRKCDDTRSLRPWAFVKNPLYPTPDTWRQMLGRDPRCLAWDSAQYQKMGAAEHIWRNPPALNEAELFKFLIGNEADPTRYEQPGDCAAIVATSAEAKVLAEPFAAAARPFGQRAVLILGPAMTLEPACHIPCQLPSSPLELWQHLAIKLVLNTISTATAARLGRVISNWMAYVETTNKKLIDRATRLVAELAGLSYAEACYELHKTRAQLAQTPVLAGERLSPVAVTLERLRKK